MFDGHLRLLARNASPSRPWYSVRNLADGEAEVFIYDFIGFDPFFGGVSAGDFVRDVRAINARKILLRINSPGGDISEAVTIRNALIEHPAQIETHVDGLAASAASWVGLAAEKVIMSTHAMMMIHEPWFMVEGDADFLRHQADVLNKFGEDIAKMFQEKAGGSSGKWRDAMREETWYSDEEAVGAGLADEVASGESAPENRYDPAILQLFKHTPGHLTKNPEPLDHDNQSHVNNGAQNPPQELVRAALAHQRNRSRELGVTA